MLKAKNFEGKMFEWKWKLKTMVETWNKVIKTLLDARLIF